MALFNGNRAAYGLSKDDTFTVRKVNQDGRVTAVRMDQFYKGIQVFEGEAIYRERAGRLTGVTNAFRSIRDLDVVPTLTRNQAVTVAVGQIAPTGAYSVSDVRLMILPRSDRNPVRDRLVWRTVVALTGLEREELWNYFIDAQSAEPVLYFDAIQETAAVGTGNTMYSGSVSLDTDFSGGTYYLRDTTRGAGNYTCDMSNRQGGKCNTITRSNDVFGNGVKDSSDRATAGADAHFGLEETWDFYKNSFGRNGIDGTGRKSYSRVHYGSNYQNAFWSDSCFCMTYGDGGSTFYPLVSLDVAGHEMSHGVMATEANLTYSGESGGLNESNSDIFGTMVEYAAASASNPDAPDYWIGERIYRSNWNGSTYTQTKALRYMDDPHKDGTSPACWTSSIGSLDVHYSSGPNNHFYYLLAEGGASKCNGNVVTGVGRAKASAIWYRAITTYMTSSTDYHGARTAALQAAAELYGAGSTEYNAVNAAYAAINVQ